jgi:FixJ family two-component response regulator
MITGFGDQSLFMEALEMGARDLILKPLDDKEILDVVRKHAQ